MVLFGAVQSASADKAQVGILISPQGGNTYRVALSYPKRVSGAKVRQEIAALVQNIQGSLIGQPMVQDYSLDPSQPKRFPVTTSALISLAYASPSDQSFAVLPAYLQAFRAEKHLQILFVSAGEGGELTTQEFVTPELRVVLTRSKGLERYEVTLLKATGTLPAPIFTASQKKMQEIPQVVSNEPVKTSGNGFGRVLLVLFSGVGAGLVIYLVAIRLVMSPKAAK